MVSVELTTLSTERAGPFLAKLWNQRTGKSHVGHPRHRQEANGMSDCIWRKKKVAAITGRSPSRIDADVKAGRFPAPVRIGPRAIGWRASEIEAWIENLERVEGSSEEAQS